MAANAEVMAQFHEPFRLKFHLELDEDSYPKGVKITDKQMAALPLERHTFHPDWYYKLLPRDPPA